MKTELKNELVKSLVEMGDVAISPQQQYAVQSVLIKILEKQHPNEDLDFSPHGAANFVHFANLDRIDFYLPGYEYTYGDGIKLDCRWSNGYKHPTPGSIVNKRFVTKDAKNVTYAEMGRANALLIEATAEAEAMKLKQKELSSTYVDYIRWSNWNGVLPTTTLSEGTGIFLNR